MQRFVSDIEPRCVILMLQLSEVEAALQLQLKYAFFSSSMVNHRMCLSTYCYCSLTRRGGGGGVVCFTGGTPTGVCTKTEELIAGIFVKGKIIHEHMAQGKLSVVAKLQKRLQPH